MSGNEAFESKKVPYDHDTTELREDKPAIKRSKRERLEALDTKDLYLQRLPLAARYERSYMHRDQLSHVLVTPSTEFVITASVDGYLKFWRKSISTGAAPDSLPTNLQTSTTSQRQGPIEFVKTYRAHVAKIIDIACTLDGSLLASTSIDETLKIYDVQSFDMINMIKLPCKATCLEWTSGTRGTGMTAKIAVGGGGDDGGKVFIFGAKDNPLAESNDHHREEEQEKKKDGFITVCLDSAPIVSMAYNPKNDSMVSIDQRGNIEYWAIEDPSGLPATHVSFKYKSETDLYTLAKAAIQPYKIKFNSSYDRFVITAADRMIRIFDYSSGKIVHQIDESIERYIAMQDNGTAAIELGDVTFGKRLAIEKEVNYFNAVFDESGHYLIYGSILGINIYSLDVDKVVHIIGCEDDLRVTHLALYQGVPKKNRGHYTSVDVMASDNPAFKDIGDIDPCIVATAMRKSRFYIYSKRDGNLEERDVINERPIKEDLEGSARPKKDQRYTTAIMRTTKGDIFVKLFPDQAPKAVENFCTHSRNGYYNNHLFHRIIRGFMIQTGDPLGDGTGGTSIWSRDFADEIHPDLVHDVPGTVSMANAGPNTNGSQFFITTRRCEWLDGKHTIFGRVVRGLSTVVAIEQVETDKSDRPIEDVRILEIEVKE